MALSLSQCFAQNTEKHLFLAGWEVELNGDAQCYAFIKTHATDKKTACSLGTAIELVFKDEVLAGAYDLEGGRRIPRPLKATEQKFRYVETPLNTAWQIVPAERAESYLGGEPPQGFQMPVFPFNAPFQYLGKLSAADEAFQWLPFDLHLVAPVYLNFDQLFIDYSDPNHPQVLDVAALEQAGTAYDDLKPDSRIVFKKVPVKAVQIPGPDPSFGCAGIPNYLQYPTIPVCPKSKKPMRFLCQLSSDDRVATAATTVQPSEAGYGRYFDHLNYWGDGDLFVFFDPESKVVCYFIQIT